MAKVCDIDRHPATDNINIGYKPPIDPGHYGAFAGESGSYIDVCIGCLTAFSDNGFQGLLDRHKTYLGSRAEELFNTRGGY